MPLLEVRELWISYLTLEGRRPALRGLSLSLERGEAYGLVGESGSGKSTLALAIVGLLPNNAAVEGGSIRLEGRELLGLPERELEKLRGREVSIIFQDPAATWNPSFRIGDVLLDVIRRRHPDIPKEEARRRALRALELAGLGEPERMMRSYPHELSGGMQQRAALAAAIAPGPKLLIADEPTTQLDATVQVEVLNSLLSLKRLGLSILLITHHLGIVSNYCERIGVLKDGELVEEGRIEELLTRPRHPYTKALLEAVPRVRR
jgi:peptide/nickel transport system ATP-binding protein